MRGLRLKTRYYETIESYSVKRRTFQGSRNYILRTKKKKERERELKASFFEHFNPPAIEIIKPDRNTVAKQWNHWKKKGRKHENTFKMMKNILKIEKNYENKIFNSSIVKLNK